MTLTEVIHKTKQFENLSVSQKLKALCIIEIWYRKFKLKNIPNILILEFSFSQRELKKIMSE